MRKTNIYLDDQDDKQLRRVRKDNGLPSDAAAIRFVLRHYESPRKK